MTAGKSVRARRCPGFPTPSAPSGHSVGAPAPAVNAARPRTAGAPQALGGGPPDGGAVPADRGRPFPPDLYRAGVPDPTQRVAALTGYGTGRGVAGRSVG